MNQKVALITGGSRGIGKGIAEKLAQDGYAVAIVGTREEEQVTEAINDIKKYNGSVAYIQGNIANKEDREDIVNTCMGKFGRIDVLVNNAGVAPKQRLDLLEMTEESMDYVLDINLKGTFFLTQLVAKKMIRAVENKQSTNLRIVNISSISAYTASINRGEYCIAKAGVGMLTKLFADRLAEHSILVYEIRPGIIATDMTAKVKDKYDAMIEKGLTPIKRWGVPEDIANAVSALCTNSFLFSTGEVINVDGGFHIRRL